MQKLPIKVLYVEDETIVLLSVTEILRRRVENVISAIDGEEGFELYKKHSPDVVITDITMPKMNGLELARKIKHHNPDIHIYLLSAYPQPDYLLEAIDIGVKGFLKKPLDKSRLFAILSEISEPALLKEKIQREEHDREIVEAALLESESKYQTLFDNLNDAIIVHEVNKDNTAGIIVEINDVTVQYLGYTREELLRMTPSDFSTNESPENTPGSMDELIEKKHYTFDSIHRSKDGKLILVEISAHLFSRQDQNYVISIIRDISAWKNYEEELLLQSHVLKNLHDNIIVTDTSGYITFVNDAVLNTLKYKRDDIVGKHIKVLGEDPEHAISQKDIMKETLENGHWQGLVINYTSNGDKVFLNSRTWILKDSTEKPIGLVVISDDITQDQIREKVLEESEEKFHTLAENIPGTVFIYEMCSDGKTRIMHYVGPGFRKMVGEEFAKEINYDATTFFDFVHPDDFDGLQKAAKEALENNEPLNYEYRMKSNNGNIIWVRSICRGTILENGNTLWQGVLTDVGDRKIAEERIRKSEELYHDLFENANDIIWMSDYDGKFTNMNRQFREILGYKKENLLGKSIHGIVNEKDKKKSKQNYAKALEGETVEYELLINTQSKKQKVLWINLRPIYENDEITGVQCFGRDISDRKNAENLLKKNEAFSNALFEYNPVETIVVDKDCKIVRYNNAIEEHRTRTPHIGYVMYKDYASKNKRDMFKILVDCIKNNERKVIPDSIYREGETSEKHFHITITPFPEGAIITSRDITRQVHAEELLKKEIEQKELLIKEINHRVKNNFALVCSLLSIQQQNIEDEEIREIFEEAQNRIQSIALVHKQLYGSEDLAHIDFFTYITSLIRHLIGGYKYKTDNISIDLDIKEVALDIAKAIPCGLIINELIANAFKHGFKNRENGKIAVKMQYLKDDKIKLTIANDGNPFPDGIDFRNTQTLGLQLVTGLVGQIGGTIELDNSKGTKFIITFNKAE